MEQTFVVTIIVKGHNFNTAMGAFAQKINSKQANITQQQTDSGFVLVTAT